MPLTFLHGDDPPMSRFVTVDDEHGYWVRNELHDLWWMLLALQIDVQMDWFAIQSRISHRWILASRCNTTGCTFEDLGSFVGEPGGFEVISAALERLKTILADMPEVLDREFALMGFRYDVGPVERRLLVAMAAAFTDLLNGKIQSKAGDHVDVLGQYGAWDQRH